MHDTGNTGQRVVFNYGGQAMSAYITRFCATHGEWDEDVDNIGECPECEQLGLTTVQLLRAEIERLKNINNEIWEHLTPDQRHLLNLKWKNEETKP